MDDPEPERPADRGAARATRAPGGPSGSGEDRSGSGSGSGREDRSGSREEPSGSAGGEKGAVAQRPAWLVDGYNVIHVTLLGGAERTGWWRRDARERLLDRVRAGAGGLGPVWVVFDGPDPGPPPDDDATLHVVFAPSADDWILRRVKADPARAVVVTADRRLAARCRHAGARVVPPGEFVAACRPQEARPRDAPP